MKASFSRNMQRRLNLDQLVTQSATMEKFLQEVLRILAREFSADVANVYLWNTAEEVLVLRATYGLNVALERKLRLRLGEGLVGNAMQRLLPMILARGSTHPAFKAVTKLGEEAYDAYMIVPAEHAGDKLGVMVLQRKHKRPFTPDELQTFKELALVAMQHLQSADLFRELHEQTTAPAFMDVPYMRPAVPPARRHEVRFAAEPAMQPVRPWVRGRALLRPKHVTLSNFEEVVGTQQFTEAQFTQALRQTEAQLHQVQASLRVHLSEWAQDIFVGHLLILKDDAYTGRIRQRIGEGVAPPVAIMQVTRAYMRFFGRSAVQAIREKQQDMKDLGVRLLTNLIASETAAVLAGNVKGKLVITRDLFPSELMFLRYEGAAGVVQVGALNVLTSHMALIAASLRLPYMITQAEDVFSIAPSALVVLAFKTREVIAYPSRRTLQTAAQELRAYRAQQAQQAHPRKSAAVPAAMTKDGTRIHILANINLLEETRGLAAAGADGIGLYRSEFPFMVRNTFPTENEQYYLYRRIIASMKGHEVAIRTLDVGGDKVLPYVHEPEDATNSILGLRAIRFTLKYRELFISQLKAILRAGYKQGRSIKIILPLISSLEEVRAAKTVLAEAVARLERLGERYTTAYQLGIMVEVPSVVWILDELAREADFFCVGTNDLVQYLLAVDRNNAMVADFYSHYHPSVLRMVKAVMTAAERNDIECTLCGQMAEDAALLPFLLGIGMRRLSVSVGKLAAMRARVRTHSLTQATMLANELLLVSDAAAVRALLERAAQRVQ